MAFLFENPNLVAKDLEQIKKSSKESHRSLSTPSKSESSRIIGEPSKDQKHSKVSSSIKEHPSHSQSKPGIYQSFANILDGSSKNNSEKEKKDYFQPSYKPSSGKNVPNNIPKAGISSNGMYKDKLERQTAISQQVCSQEIYLFRYSALN